MLCFGDHLSKNEHRLLENTKEAVLSVMMSKICPYFLEGLIYLGVKCHDVQYLL